MLYLVATGLSVASWKGAAAENLPAYNVDTGAVTVAGVSSGGFMAMQLQVAFSSRFAGAAVIAGGPYYCAEGSAENAMGRCATGSALSVATLATYINAQATAGTIDSPSHLFGKSFYLFSGKSDMTVRRPVMDALSQYLANYVDVAHLTYDNQSNSGHGWVSPDGTNACNSSFVPFLNDCGIDIEHTFLSQFYGPLQSRNSGVLTGRYAQFDQTPFCIGGNCGAIGMDSTGWIFVPQTCANGAKCRLVVALHGCLMYQGIIADAFVKSSGLSEWADTNDIIVLYPEAAPLLSVNPYGCWDWWGFTGGDYALKSSVQMATIMKMVDRLASGDGTTTSEAVDAGARDAMGELVRDSSAETDGIQTMPVRSSGCSFTSRECCNAAPLWLGLLALAFSTWRVAANRRPRRVARES